MNDFILKVLKSALHDFSTTRGLYCTDIREEAMKMDSDKYFRLGMDEEDNLKELDNEYKESLEKAIETLEKEVQ